MPRSKPARFVFTAIYLAAAVLVTFAALRAGHGGDRAPSARGVGTGTIAAAPDALSHAAGEMASAAGAWWSALSAEEQAKAHFELADENRFDWDFVPRVRKGLTYKEMTSAQRALAVGLLSSGLSNRGFLQAETIMSLDQILKEMEPGPPKTPYRDPENYSFSIFGSPTDKNWAWRVEGHHFYVMFTIIDGKTVVGGPVFYGTNPAEVREGPRKGLRVLALEDDLGHELIKSFDEAQKKKAIFDTAAPKEIITHKQRKSDPGPPVGLPFSEFNEAQKQMLMHLVSHHAHRLRSELAVDDLQKIETAGWDKVYFGWAGGLEAGEGHYYRIHGPTFLIEFDDVQNNANHVHSVWRDSANDFGEDLLKAHYEATPHGAK